MSLRSSLRKIMIFQRIYGICYGTFFRMLVLLNPKWFYYLRCRISPLGRWPNLKNPKTYADKMVWLIFNWRHPLKSRCADKYAVREYAKECGCEEILIPLIGAWDRVEDIEFDSLPQRFALKCNHGCGSNIICKDKSKLDVDDAKRKLAKWMKIDYGKYSGEIHYSRIRPKIICEELLDDGVHVAPIDYKFHCLSGRVFGCNVILDRVPGQLGAKELIMDRNWKRAMLLREEEPLSVSATKPARYEEMVDLAEKLAKPFPVVRVDFYYVNDKIYLGELTFTSAGGLGTGWSDEAQIIMGDLIQLPEPIK